MIRYNLEYTVDEYSKNGWIEYFVISGGIKSKNVNSITGYYLFNDTIINKFDKLDNKKWELKSETI